MEKVVVVQPDRAALDEAVRLATRRVVPDDLRILACLNRVLLLVAQFALGAGLVILVAALSGGLAPQGPQLLGGFVAVVLLSGCLSMVLRRGRLGLLDTRVALAPRTWRIGLDGFGVEAAGFSMRSDWAQVDAVERGRLGLSVSVAGSVWVLPRAALASDAEMEEVEAFLRERVTAAQAGRSA